MSNNKKGSVTSMLNPATLNEQMTPRDNKSQDSDKHKNKYQSHISLPTGGKFIKKFNTSLSKSSNNNYDGKLKELAINQENDRLLGKLLKIRSEIGPVGRNSRRDSSLSKEKPPR